MSVLNFPRVYFSGAIAWDPVTTNNYLSAASGGQPPPEPNGGPVAQAGYDESGARTFLNGAPVTPDTMAAFRDAAVNEIPTMIYNGNPSGGSWNPQGTYRSPFFDSQVSGVDLGRGLDTTDSFVTAPVNFTGMLVDCEPYGAFSSQLFFDDISFGIAGGCRVYGRRMTRFNDRFINFSANPYNNMIAGVASVMWQTCFSKANGLDIDAVDSRVLARLKSELTNSAVLGLMVRFVTYQTVYYDDPLLPGDKPAIAKAAKALQDKIRSGGWQPNPARSQVRGTLGLWMRGDCVTEASDRALVATGARIPNAPPPPGQPPNYPQVGTVFAQVNRSAVTLDLSNAIPAGNRAGDRLDMGTLTLIASDPPPAVARMVVGTIPASLYTGDGFNATSGIVDIKIQPGMSNILRNMNLSLEGPGGPAYAVEQVLRALPFTPNLYLDQGDASALTAQVYQRGVPAGPDIQVTKSNILSTDPQDYEIRTTDSTGRVWFPLDTSSPTVVAFGLQAGPNPQLPLGPIFDPMVFPYIYVRVLPQDGDIAILPPTWQNVYARVLVDWKAMAPCMDNWLDLADPDQVLRYGPLIRQLTAPENFEGFRYMPVTRDLSQGKRTLLYNFLNTATLTASVTVDAANPVRDIMALSRAMRS